MALFMGPIHTADGLRARRELRVGRKRSISEEISPDVDISGVMLFLVLLTAGKSGKTKQTGRPVPIRNVVLWEKTKAVFEQN